VSYQQVTLTVLQQRLQDRYDNTPFWTNEEARTSLNEALRVWNALTGYWRTRKTNLVTLTNDPWHPLTGSLTYRTRIELNGVALKPTSIFSMDNHRPNWEGETTATGGAVPNTVKFWMPAGLQLIALWPADAVGNQTLTVDGVVSTPVLINGGDFVDIGEEEINTLTGYALHVLTFKIGGAVFKATMPLYQAFLAAAGNRNAIIRAADRFRQSEGLDVGREQNAIKDKEQ
jgi:hypothetical protein